VYGQLDQAKSKDAKGDGFDKLEQRLKETDQEFLEANRITVEVPPQQPNILDSLKLDQALKLANRKAKAGSPEEAKRIYKNILAKFPKNKRAGVGLKGLAGMSVGKASKIQDAPKVQLQSLMALYNKGQLALVVEHAEVITKQYPQAFVAWRLMGASLAQIGLLDQAILAFKRVLTIKPDDANVYNNMGNALKDQGKLEEAINAYNEALAIKPDYADAYYNMGVTLQEQDKLEEAIEAYNKALAIKPDDGDAYNNMGNALKDQGKLEEAIEAYNKALAIKPDDAEAYNNMGNAVKDQGMLEEAIEVYNKALAIKPDYAEAYYNMGNALKDQGKLEEAIEAYNKALAIKPDYANACYNMGVTLQEQSKLKEAAEAYNKALAIKPDYAEAYNNMGVTLQEQRKLEEAIEAYNKALAIKPDYAEAYNNMGNAVKDQGMLEEAIEVYNKALAIKPDYAEAHYNMGFTLQEQGKLEEAINFFNKALTIKPDYAEARVQKLYQQAHICDWDNIAADLTLLPELETTNKHISPFALLPFDDAPERHRTRSEEYADAKFRQKSLPLREKPSQKPKRIRLGYFSADFHNHATMYLMSQVFALHDKFQFEILAYSYGPDQQDNMRQQLVNNVDVFHDVRNQSDMQIVELARADALDIAIDLKGYTKFTRLGPFAFGLAPIQINYLGYPGTLGTDFIDYIIADSVLIPDDQRQHYSEQMIYLPHTYQPTDNMRYISNKRFTRKQMGLPDNGFVFCCFNNNYKISPSEFGIWMRLLSKVEGSVLWLLKSNNWAEQNLRKEAQARGIDPNRLVFAEKISQAEHLARQTLADLFLDTFNYNAHTTASDALWAGLPVVTKMGQGFAARVAGSLLTAVGLVELITETEQDYEALILDLATNPTKLVKVKEKLAANRLTQPLFNSELYTKHLEKGYKLAYQNYFEGNPPQTISLLI